MRLRRRRGADWRIETCCKKRLSYETGFRHELRKNETAKLYSIPGCFSAYAASRPSTPAGTANKCSVSSPPSYKPTGTIPVTVEDLTKKASFSLAAAFDTDAATGKKPSCNGNKTKASSPVITIDWTSGTRAPTPGVTPPSPPPPVGTPDGAHTLKGSSYVWI